MAKFGLSQSIRRVEDPRLLKGDGRYTADISLAGEAQGVVLRSPHAHAAIKSISTSAAKAKALSNSSCPAPASRTPSTRQVSLGSSRK